jgi:hypothetical protein
MTATLDKDTFAALHDIAELLDGAWDAKSSENYVIRAYMVATGTLLRHQGTLSSDLARARQELKPLFKAEVVDNFGKLDPLGAVVEINALVDGTWTEASEDNYLVQAFMRSTELMLEKGALNNGGTIARRYEELKASFPQAPSI